MKRTFLKLSVILLFASSACGMGNSNQDLEEQAKTLIKEMDKNADGKLDKSEMISPLNEEVFDRFDKNTDGFLDVKEAVEILKTMKP